MPPPSSGRAILVSGTNPQAHNVTNPLLRALSGGVDLPRLETPRLRSSYLVAMAETIGLAAFMEAAGVTCHPAPGRPRRPPLCPARSHRRRPARRSASVTNALSRIEAVLDEPDLAATIGALEAALPLGARRRQFARAHFARRHARLSGRGSPERVPLGRPRRAGRPRRRRQMAPRGACRLEGRPPRGDLSPGGVHGPPPRAGAEKGAIPNGAPSAALQGVLRPIARSEHPGGLQGRLAGLCHRLDRAVESFSRPPR